jgi:uncharacterized protein (UPF0147 family)
VQDIDKHLESRIADVIEVVSKNEKANVPENVRTAANEIIKQLDNTKSAVEAISLLKDIKSSKKYVEYSSIETGIELAIGILEDGLSTIYLPTSEPTVMYEGVGEADAAGAVTGAIDGA